jgi:hypothetical protein
MKFEWDPKKAESNYNKHQVTFDEAESVFDDINAIYNPDETTEEEERFIVIGISEEKRKLTVCHCFRDRKNEIIRIISARRATKAEAKIYDEGVIRES